MQVNKKGKIILCIKSPKPDIRNKPFKIYSSEIFDKNNWVEHVLIGFLILF